MHYNSRMHQMICSFCVNISGYYHCHAHNLSAVGLRFFTVYGPWGRPDMAVYKFGEAIVERKKVPMFHTTLVFQFM